LIESVVQRTCVEVRTLASERLNELEAQIRVLADAKAKASEPFKFAGEKADDDSLVLPNPLRRREIN
jgi:hypothetical protein